MHAAEQVWKALRCCIDALTDRVLLCGQPCGQGKCSVPTTASLQPPKLLRASGTCAAHCCVLEDEGGTAGVLGAELPNMLLKVSALKNFFRSSTAVPCT